MNRALVIALGFLLAVAQPCGAEMRAMQVPPAAMVCQNVDILQSYLKLKYGERLVVMGQERGKGQFRLYYSDHSGSWTLAWVDLNGIACARIFGTHRKGFFGIGT